MLEKKLGTESRLHHFLHHASDRMVALHVKLSGG
jgi:hypothetical protein